MTAPDSSSLPPQTFENLDIHSQTSLAETALRLAKKAGAGYADIRIGRNQDESAYARERINCSISTPHSRPGSACACCWREAGALRAAAS